MSISLMADANMKKRSDAVIDNHTVRLLSHVIHKVPALAEE